MNYSENKMLNIFKISLPFLVFIIVLVIHMFISIWKNIEVLQNLGMININYLSLYLDTVNQYKGLSLAMAGSYISYMIIKFFEIQNNGSKFIFRGIIISFIVFFVLTFLVGYYSKFVEEFLMKRIGWIFIPIRKRFLFILVVISILSGFFYLRKKLKSINMDGA